MIKFPLTIGKTATVSSYPEQVAQQVEHRLRTSQGSIMGNRAYGSLVKASLFENNADIAQARAVYHAKNALKKEEAIDLRKMRVVPSPNDSTLTIEVVYSITATAETSTLTTTL